MENVRFKYDEIMKKVELQSNNSYSNTDICNCPENCSSYACVPTLCHCTPTNCAKCAPYACA